MYTFGKKRISVFVKTKYKPENRILKSGIQPLMESGIPGCGIRNPQTWNPESTAWNPESKTLLDYPTWGENDQAQTPDRKLGHGQEKIEFIDC